MNSYFFKMTQAERNNILDQHKKVYDGFVTDFGQQVNQQPLYIQDFANDKVGLVVNNKGEVKPYTNMNINETNAMTGSKYVPDVSFDFGGPNDGFESEYVGFGGQDMIGDSESDMEHGTFDDDEDEDDYDYDVEEFRQVNPKFKDINLYELENEIGDDEIAPLQEQLNKTLEMFRKFKKY